jgi:transposase-like protein
MDANVPTTLHESISYFSNPDNCMRTAIAMRWPDGKITCPTCGSQNVTLLKTRRIWKCNAGHVDKRQFSVKVGTIFEDSPIGLDKWFTAIWLIGNCKNGVSSCEIARDLGVTQKTAWFMLHRIRKAMARGTFEKFAGEVEADETFIGGLARFMHKDKKVAKITGTGGAGKELVMGLLDRETGKVRVKHVANRKRGTLQEEVRANVEAGSEVFTDELASYTGLDKDYIHQFVNHAEEYVRGNVHTNGIENFWSLLKRGLKGTYVSVEPFHLFRYLDEQAFRYNERKGTDRERFMETLFSTVGRRVTYKQLTGKTKPATETLS